MNGRIPALDGLRGICVIGVLLTHAGLPFARGGFLGVDGFFVLSGYLITTLLLKEHARSGRIDLAAFYIRRALRLLPALFLLILAVTLWLLLTRPPAEIADANVRGVWASLLYVGNWVKIITGTGEAVNMGVLGHTWSLAIEEQFYIIWPVALIALLRRSPRRLPYVLVTAIVASSLWRAVLLTTGTPAGSYRVYDGTDTRADSILLGCLVAVLLSQGIVRPAVRYTRLAALFSVPVLALMWAAVPAMSPFLYLGGFTLDALLFACLMLHMHASPTGRAARLLSWRPLVAVGTVSYGLYLWHWPIYQWLPAHEWADWPVQAARLVLVVLVVAASYRYLEQPFLRLKGVLGRPRTTAAVPAAR